MRRIFRFREMIGRVANTYRAYFRWAGTVPQRDLTQSDAQFLDKARRGKASGLEISGLLIKPIVSKVASWVLGQAPALTLEESEPSQQALTDWWGVNHTTILQAYEDALALGDCFLVVNADLTLTVVPPHVVERVVDEADYSVTAGWKISERWPHPQKPGQTMTIEDTYTAEERVRRLYRDGVLIDEQRYPNLLGIIPVVKISNNVGANEFYGRSEVEALIEALHKYGENFEAALYGNRVQGRSIPYVVFQDHDALQTFWDTYAERKTQTLEDGTVETYYNLELSSENVVAMTGGDIRFASPAPMTGDTARLLELLFYLVLEHSELPEFVLGTAVASSKASVDTQMPVFAKFIEKKQGQAAGWVLDLARVVLGYLELTSPGVVAGEVSVGWAALTGEDEKLTMAALQWAYTEGLIDRKTALMLAPLDIKDVDAVLEAAQEEGVARQEAAMERDFGAQLERALVDNTADDGQGESQA